MLQAVGEGAVDCGRGEFIPKLPATRKGKIFFLAEALAFYRR